MGRAARQIEPERRCVVTGDSGTTQPMIRFVLGPDGAVTPDLSERLPGRGAWLMARPDVLDRAMRKNPFPRAFRQKAELSPDLPERLADLLLRRCQDLLGLARGAGQAIAGYEKVREFAEAGPVGAMIVAADGGSTAHSRARKLAFDAPVIDLFDRAELSLALGRENVVHAAVAPGRLAQSFVRDTERLRMLKGLPDNLRVEKRTVND